jgi:hypothetical protein
MKLGVRIAIVWFAAACDHGHDAPTDGAVDPTSEAAADLV